MASTIDDHRSIAAFDAILAADNRQRRQTLAIVTIVLAVIAIACWFGGLFDVLRLLDGLGAIGTLLLESLPPDFTRAGKWLEPLFDTLVMSISGTALAVLLSVPLGLLGARNVAPNNWVYQTARTVLNILRSIPELILGIVFVAAVGFGMLPGILALGLHSVGMVGKFFSEAVEHAHPAPIEAARATGANRVQVVAHGVLPQVLPQFADVAMYRWEYNFRASTVMGMVGAGGIGTELMGSLRLMDYNQVSALLLVILGCVTIVDWLSGRLRQHFK